MDDLINFSSENEQLKDKKLKKTCHKQKAYELIDNKFEKFLKEKKDGNCIIYTDGSVNQGEGRSGLSIYCTVLNINFILKCKGRLNGKMLIFDLEAKAVFRALNFKEVRDVKKATIFSDYKSVLTVFKNTDKRKPDFMHLPNLTYGTVHTRKKGPE